MLPRPFGQKDVPVMATTTKTVVINRDAKTGEFVKPGYVKTHPATTTVEHRKVVVNNPPPKKK